MYVTLLSFLLLYVVWSPTFVTFSAPQDMVSTLRDPLPLQEMVSTLRDPLPPQEMVPTLRYLCLLPVPNWYLLGLQLRVTGHELDVIESNYPRDNHMCKVKMFGAWLRMGTSATYEKLARALVTLGNRNVAEAMCASRGTKAKHLNVCVYNSARTL